MAHFLSCVQGPAAAFNGIYGTKAPGRLLIRVRPILLPVLPRLPSRTALSLSVLGVDAKDAEGWLHLHVVR